MRIRFENRIEEIVDIEVVKSYVGNSGKCDIVTIWMKKAGESNGEYVGCYDLDYLEESEADDEANAILETLLTRGWCEANDFGHFIWY